MIYGFPHVHRINVLTIYSISDVKTKVDISGENRQPIQTCKNKIDSTNVVTPSESSIKSTKRRVFIFRRFE